ncbi:hypothetical protein [Arthrobacter sp. NPDC058127]|uniref:hypothetical protein n=1 Tax=Arthrobacter sp. NPDC058127 TaxID=3346351 RepID=UPI0036E5329D
MLIPILTTIGLAAATIWLSYVAAKYLFPRFPSLSALRQARRDRIAQDPGDYVRAWVARINPSRLRVAQQAAAAERHIERTQERETHILTAFKDGKAPTLAFKITAITMFTLWFVMVTTAFIFDLPIINSVSGGNVFYAFLGALLILGVPIIGSVLLGHFFLKWRRGELSEILFSLVATLILAAVVVVVALLTTLAPIRAEVEYADKIRTAEQQKTMYTEDGDQNAMHFAEQNLAELQAQQHRSAEWNTALVPTASVGEFATGFFVPLAVPVLMLGASRASRHKAQRVVDTSQNRVNNHDARQYRRLSRTFRRVGLTQAALRQHFATVAAENQTGQEAAGTAEGARVAVADELQAQTPTSSDQTVTTANTPTTAEPATTTAQSEANPKRAAAAARPTPTPPPASTPERDFDVPDESFDLS